jgi:ABC-2 type transport system permease protein
MLYRVWAEAAHETRLLLRDPAPIVVSIAMPLLLIPFLQPMFHLFLAETGHPNMSGAAFAIPGAAVMFAFFLAGFAGFSFYHEHEWGTWSRLRASPGSAVALVVGKLLPWLVTTVVQVGVLLLAGWLLFHVRIQGSVIALAVLAVLVGLLIVSVTVAAVAVCTTVQQLNTVTSLGAILLGGLGGALTPTVLLPVWARWAGKGLPSTWAIEGFRSVVVDGRGLGAVLGACAVLVAWSAGLCLVAVFRFRFQDVKVSWS